MARTKTTSHKAAPRPKKRREVEEINSDEIDGEFLELSAPSYHEEEEQLFVQEDDIERKMRAAKEFLASIEDQEALMSTAQKEALAASIEPIADLGQKLYELYEQDGEDIFDIEIAAEFKTPVTSVTTSSDGSITAVSCKNGDITVFDTSNSPSEKLFKIKGLPKLTRGRIHPQGRGSSVTRGTDMKGHYGCVNSVSLSSDGDYLISAGEDGFVLLWDIRESCLNKSRPLHPLESFAAHLGSVTCVKFAPRSKLFFSGGVDKIVCVYSVEELTLIRRLHGNEDTVTGLDALNDNKVFSCGADRSFRTYGIFNASQLVYRGHRSGAPIIESCSAINHGLFVTGAQNGSVNLWSSKTQKPIVNQKLAEEEVSNCFSWVTAVASVKKTDLCASGSYDSGLIMWQIDPENKEMNPVAQLPVNGFVNQIDFDEQGRSLAVAVSQEPKLGRWRVDNDAMNALMIIRLPDLATE